LETGQGQVPTSAEHISRAAHRAAAATIQHVRVDHRRLYIRMSRQLLDGPYVVTVFEKMRRKRVAKAVTGFSTPRPSPRRLAGDRDMLGSATAVLLHSRVSIEFAA
jgi:hypothetical protein